MSHSDVPQRLQDEINNMPLADEDVQEDLSRFESSRDRDVGICSSLPTSTQQHVLNHVSQSIESLSSMCANGMDSPSASGHGGHSPLDPDLSPDEAEEKDRLIVQVLELQNTLDDLSQRVDGVKEENLKLKSENQVLGQYIDNLMSASSVFQSTSPKMNKRSGSSKK